MLKSRFVSSVLMFFLSRKVHCQPRSLSAHEKELIDQYRCLTETDQAAMRYLIEAMKNLSRF